MFIFTMIVSFTRGFSGDIVISDDETAKSGSSGIVILIAGSPK